MLFNTLLLSPIFTFIMSSVKQKMPTSGCSFDEPTIKHEHFVIKWVDGGEKTVLRGWSIWIDVHTVYGVRKQENDLVKF